MADNSPSFCKEIILEQVRGYRTIGEAALRMSGIQVDEILAREIAVPNTDTRHGITIIARPPLEVIAEIRRIQGRLLACEPYQYYYPGPDLHVTILEVCYGRTPADVGSLIEKIAGALPGIFCDLPTPVFRAAGFSFDPKGCAINFLPLDDRLQALRARLRERLEGIGLSLQSRYPPTAAHVSLFRYLRPLQAEKSLWADYLANTQVDPLLTWKIQSLYITWGANWYGNWSRIQAAGPFRLEPG